jgi:hypothetical protein
MPKWNCRKLGIRGQTLHRWKAKFGETAANEARRLQSLEDENRRLKQMVADISLDNQALKAMLKNVVTPLVRRAVVHDRMGSMASASGMPVA